MGDLLYTTFCFYEKLNKDKAWQSRCSCNKRLSFCTTNFVECRLYLEEQAQENPFIELAPAKDESQQSELFIPSRADKRDEESYNEQSI